MLDRVWGVCLCTRTGAFHVNRTAVFLVTAGRSQWFSPCLILPPSVPQHVYRYVCIYVHAYI